MLEDFLLGLSAAIVEETVISSIEDKMNQATSGQLFRQIRK